MTNDDKYWHAWDKYCLLNQFRVHVNHAPCGYGFNEAPEILVWIADKETELRTEMDELKAEGPIGPPGRTVERRKLY